jgi:hypothetical protein
MKTCSRILFTLLLASALPAAAQTLDWTTVGSAGVSTSANPLFAVSGPAVYVPTNAIETLEFRYPVTNTYGSASSKQPGWTTFSMTYADNSSTAGSVVAQLMEVDSCSSTERQICSITSADGDGSTTCDTCALSSTIDFSNHAYYVHVTITKTDLPADPRLYELAIY